MEKFEPLKKIENIKIIPPSEETLEFISNQRIKESVKNIPTPILILYLDVSRIDLTDVDEFSQRTAESFDEALVGTGWVGLVIPIFSGQDSRIEVVTVSDIPHNFEEFKEELLKRIKEIHGSS